MEETKKAYKEIIELLNKYKDIIVYDVQELERAIEKLKEELQKLESN